MNSFSLNWSKSSYSGGDNNCVECAAMESRPGHAIAVRDSKDPSRGTLHFTAAAWHAFLRDRTRG